MSHLARCLFALCLAAAVSLRAQDALSDAPLNPPQVDQLLGPIALYPDALVALILPASTTPGDIVLAQRYLSSGGDPEQIDNQPWNDSVKALARYPTVIKWLDDNLTWTQQLGQAFANQPDDVMNAVQRLRTRARASGALKSTAQQKLVLDGDIIEIVPAQPDVIYVPYYDPNLVYGGMPGYYYDGPYLTFGLGLPVGFWLSYDFNWRQHALWMGDRHHNWHEHGDWVQHYGAGGRPPSGNWHRWQPPANRPPYARPPAHPAHPELNRPTPFPGSPPYPPHDAPSHTPDQPKPDTHAHEADRNHGPISNTNNNPPVRPDTADHSDHHDTRPGPVPVTNNSNPPVRPQPTDHRDQHDSRSGPVPAPTTPRPETNPNRATAPYVQPAAPAAPTHADRPMPAASPRPEVHLPPTGNPPPASMRSVPRDVNPSPPPVHVPAPPPPSKDGTHDKDPQAAR